MSPPAVLDVDALVAPVPGPDPAGAPLSAAVLLELDDARREADPLDPATAGRSPDWAGVVRVTSGILTRTSKDLAVAARLVEAATRESGFAGLRDGLRLLHRLATDCWDRLHPAPAGGDGFDVREGPLRWLNDAARGAKFPQTVADRPLVRAGTRTFSYLDWLRPGRRAEFEDAIPTADPACLSRARGELVAARDALRALAAALDDRLGADLAPDFLTEENESNLGTAIGRCLGLVEEVARRRGAPLADPPAVAAPDPGGEPIGAGPAAGVADTREGLYRQLEEVAAGLMRAEPHSPIPYLLRRCVRLGALPFPDLMRALVRDAAALSEFDRLLGVERPA